MKKFTLAVILAMIICTAASIFGNAREVEAVTDKLIRIHVIANSDSEADQSLKLKVRDGINAAVSELTSSCASKEEAMESLRSSLDGLRAVAEKTVAENGFDCKVSCTLGREEFDERRYDDFVLPAGEYDSLCIRLGEAAGKNWWCVCYPSICVGAAMSVEECGAFDSGELLIIKEPEKVRYKLWCFEAIRKLRKFFAD